MFGNKLSEIEIAPYFLIISMLDDHQRKVMLPFLGTALFQAYNKQVKCKDETTRSKTEKIRVTRQRINTSTSCEIKANEVPLAFRVTNRL